MFIFFLISVEGLGLDGILLGVHCAGLCIGLFLLGKGPRFLVFFPFFLLTGSTSKFPPHFAKFLARFKGIHFPK